MHQASYPGRAWSRSSGIAKKKLRTIAERLQSQYVKAGGETLDLDIGTVRTALGDSVTAAFRAIETLQRNRIPRELLPLLPEGEVRFELECENQPEDPRGDPDFPQKAPIVLDATQPFTYPPGHCGRCGYRFTVPGERCPNCDDIEGPAVIAEYPAPMPPAATGQPKPAEGFQFCPRCSSGEVSQSGGICPVCDAYVDAVYVPDFSPEDME